MYYSKLLYRYKTDSKRTWKQKTKSNLLHRGIKVNKIIMKNPQDIAKEFNKFFTSVEPKLPQKNLNEKILKKNISRLFNIS